MIVGLSRTACACVVLLAPAFAAAQPWSGDARRTATAQALFDEGRALMQTGEFAKACPKLEEALRLEPNGVGAKLKLAECYEGAQRLASAVAMYAIAETSARAANQNDRALWAHDRGALLKPKVPTLTITVDEHTGNLAGFVVIRDGVEVRRAQWGTAMPVDGGSIEVVASAPGRVSFKEVVVVRNESDAANVKIAALAQLAPEPVASGIEPQLPAPAPEPAPAGQADGGRVPVWAWVTGSLGLATGIAGVAFRIDAAVVEAEQADECGPGRDRCGRGYDVDGTNARKDLDFKLFVGLGVTGAAAVSAGLIGAIVGLTDRGGAPAKKSKISLWIDSPQAGATIGLRGTLE